MIGKSKKSKKKKGQKSVPKLERANKEDSDTDIDVEIDAKIANPHQTPRGQMAEYKVNFPFLIFFTVTIALNTVNVAYTNGGAN